MAARDPNVRIVILTKGESIGRSGATMLACEPLSSCVLDSKSAQELVGLKRGDTRDSPEAFFDDVVTYGDFVSDQRLVNVVVNGGPIIARKLKDWGFVWNYDIVDRSPGHRYPRDYYGEKAWGPQFLKLGASLLKECRNVEIIYEIIALDLLVSNGRIAGLTAIDLRTGELILLKCKSVILATGGCQNVYSRVTTGRELTGDGFAMAFRAGAEMMDMEFVKFYTMIAWPEGAGHDPSALLQAFRHTSHWLNKYGQRFMERWNSANLEGDGDGWNSVSKIAIATEILGGKGGKHGIYYSIQHLPKNLVDYESEWGHLRSWKAESTHYDYSPYVEMMKNGYALEITLAAHYNEGGIVIDEECRSGIKGLYAAGEASAGVDGGQRVAGMALTSSFVQGAVAAESCLEYLGSASQEELDPNQVEESRTVAYSVLKDKEGGISPIELRKRIQSVADKTVWAVRDEASLKFALDEVPKFRRDLGRMILQTNGLNYNPEFVEAIQARNLVDCLEMIATAALVRKESRGGHYRSDFSQTNNDQWLRNIILSRGHNATIDVTTRPVAAGIIPLPRGKYEYGEYFNRIDRFQS